jgi:hypothetical protein
LNGDGRLDVVVAQFATRPYVLMNETLNGILRLVERTPPEIPTTVSGFRTKLFDANGDGTPDIWLALRTQNFLDVTLKAEAEPNDAPGTANAVATYPALRTGAIGGPRSGLAAAGGDSDLQRDLDYFTLPARAIAEGARIRLRPASDADLKLTLYDAMGILVADSQVPGNGALEEIVVSANTPGTTLQVDRQSGTGTGSGAYRLEIAPVNGIQLAPEPPFKPGPRVGLASSTGDGCHRTLRPPPRAKYSNP